MKKKRNLLIKDVDDKVARKRFTEEVKRYADWLGNTFGVDKEKNSKNDR